MLVLGLVLILGSAALGAGFAFDGSEAATVEILGKTVHTSAAGLFFTGAAAMLLFVLGVWMLTSSMGRSRRKRGERKATRRQQKESVAQLEADRAKLAAENERLSEQLGSRQDTASTPSNTST
jgi:cell division protein FtsB